MRNILDSFAHQMISLNIERNGKVITEVKGLKNTQKSSGRKMFDFYPDTDVQPNDWIVMPNTGMRFYVIDVDVATANGSIFKKIAFYLTESEYASQDKQDIHNHQHIVFNIDNPHNSIIGTQAHAILSVHPIDDLKQQIESNGGNDKDALYNLLDELQVLINNNQATQKGALEKFSDLLAKHAWLTAPLGSLLVNWLFNR